MCLYKDTRNFVYDIPSLSHADINIDSIQEPPKHAYQNRVLTTTILQKIHTRNNLLEHKNGASNDYVWPRRT